MTLGVLLVMLRSIERDQGMAFISLTEAVDRVLARLAEQRNEKPGEVVRLPGKVARGGVAQGNKSGCVEGREHAPLALRQRQGEQTRAGTRRPVGRLLKG